jgi:hypothetical protein
MRYSMILCLGFTFFVQQNLFAETLSAKMELAKQQQELINILRAFKGKSPIVAPLLMIQQCENGSEKLKAKQSYNNSPVENLNTENDRIPLTALSKEDAHDLFNQIKKIPNLPFEYPDGGSAAFAHKISLLLADKGINTGKVFVDGALEINVGQNFEKSKRSEYVGTIVMVKEGNKTVPYIFDPVLFDQPVPKSKWDERINNNDKSKIITTYMTSRYAYDLNDYNIDKERKSYSEGTKIASEEKRAKMMNTELLRMQEVLDTVKVLQNRAVLDKFYDENEKKLKELKLKKN